MPTVGPTDLKSVSSILPFLLLIETPEAVQSVLQAHYIVIFSVEEKERTKSLFWGLKYDTQRFHWPYTETCVYSGALVVILGT